MQYEERTTDPALESPGRGAVELSTPGIAIGAMVLGIAGLATSCVFIGLFMGIGGLVLGLMALNQIDREPERYKGRGMAMSGAITGGTAIVLGLIVPLLIGIMLPALGAARQAAQRIQSNANLRFMQQSNHVYAQTNNSYFPGLARDGEIDDATVEARLQLLLDGRYIDPETLLSPFDQGKRAWLSGPLTEDAYSYAILEIATGEDRRDEWRDTSNTGAVMMSDRNVGTIAASPESVQSEGMWIWRGGIVRNDTSTSQESTHQVMTQYGSGPQRTDDHLFEASEGDEAWMIYTGR